MSFNRISYDNSAYNLQMERSTKPGDYMLFGSYGENCKQCLSYDGPRGSKVDVSTVKTSDLSNVNMVDVESKLSWRNHSLAKTNENINDIKIEVNHKPLCTQELVSEDTRFTNPIMNYRSMSLTPLMLSPYLNHNPQCYMQEYRELSGTNTRNDFKDSYKPIQKIKYTNNVLPNNS